MLKSRSLLVEMRTKLTDHLGGMLKTFGIIWGNARDKPYEARLKEVTVGKEEFYQIVTVILGVWRNMCERIETLDRNISQPTVTMKHAGF